MTKAIATTSNSHAAVSAESLYENLRAKTSHARKLKNLEIIWAVLEDQEERGSEDYSLATIGKISEANGGPKTQSLRNTAGRDFRDLIEAYAAEVGGRTKKAKKLSVDEEALLHIEDLALRQHVVMIMAENRSLKNQNQILQKAFKSSALGGGEAPAIEAEIKIIPPSEKLAPSEIKAVQNFIEKNVPAEGWTVQKSGKIVNENGRTIAPVGFLHALNKMLTICTRK